MTRAVTKMDARVTIERHEAVYRVSRSYPSPVDLCSRLDGLTEKKLAECCGRLLEPMLDSADPSVWLIRRLDVDLLLNTGSVDEDTVARAWGGRIASTIAKTISGGPQGEDVLHFPDRATYLAQFAIDVVHGQAWNKWYYKSFDSLRSLPPTVAAGEALVREPEHAFNAIRCLWETRRGEEFLRALAARDVHKVYEASFTLDIPLETAQIRARIRLLLQAWPEASLDLASRHVATPHNRLRLLMAVAKLAPELDPDTNLRAAIDCLLELNQALQGIEKNGLALQQLHWGNLELALDSLRSVTGPDTLNSLVKLVEIASGDGGWVSQVIRAVESHASPVTSATHGLARSFATPFAALFLLLPALLDLDLPEMAGEVQAADSREINQAEFLRFLLALKLVGGNRSDVAFGDPALHLFAGMDVPLTRGTFHEHARSCRAETQLSLLESLGRGLRRQGLFEGRWLDVELAVIDNNNQAVLLLRDLERDTWVYAEYVELAMSSLQRTLHRGLEFVRRVCEREPEFLLISSDEQTAVLSRDLVDIHYPVAWTADQPPTEGRFRCLDLSSMDCSARVWAESPELISSDLRTVLASYLRRRKPSGQEWTYFSLRDLAPSAMKQPGIDSVGTLLARAVFKGVARRLMGFECSSAEYLYRNFLEGVGAIRIDDQQITVDLPSPPLAVMLRLAGVDGQTYLVPWLSRRSVKLSLGGQ